MPLTLIEAINAAGRSIMSMCRASCAPGSPRTTRSCATATSSTCRRAEEAYLLGEVTRIFQLDTSTPTGLLLGTRFVLEPGDVVYVVRSPLQRWNDTISRLLPTVQAISVADDLAN